MELVLIHLRPWDEATQARVDVYIGDAAVHDAYGLNAHPWEPAVKERPALSIELFDPDISGKVMIGKLALSLALSQVTAVPNPHLLYWTGAPVTVYTVADLAWDRRIVEFNGKVTATDLDKLNMSLSIDGEVDTSLIEKPLLRLEFDGGGGLGGDGEKLGVLKPAGFGTVYNIEPVWFDLTDNIGMIDGYGNCLTIDWLAEGLSSTGFAFVDDYPTYADLKAAIVAGTIGRGQWGTCIADGCVGLGAPPSGRITVHATFGAGTAGAWMKRILLTHAQLDVGDIVESSFDALDVSVPFDTGWWTADQREIPDLLGAIAASCNASALVDFQARVLVTRASKGAPVAALDYSGSSEPRVTKYKSIEAEPPFYIIKARTARPAAVFSFSEVNYSDTLDDTNGLWDVAEVYRAGDIVWRADGSRFLYINDLPEAGHEPPAATSPPDPPAADAWWQQLTPPVSYADGTPIDDLKPAEAGANITATHTAAAIAGQGALATANQVNLGAAGTVYRDDGATHLTDAAAVTAIGTAAAIASQGALATLSQVNLGAGGRVYRDDGSTRLTDALAVTSIGTAAAIASQGALATLSQVNLGASGRVYRDDGTTRLTDALAVTALGTASAIASQGWFATQNTAGLGTTQTGIYGRIYRETGVQLTDNLAVTSLGTAAAIASQGALATLSQVNLGASGRVYRDDGSTRLTDALAVTSLGTASAIASQGWFATQNTAGLGLTQTGIYGRIYRETGAQLTDNLAVTSLGTASAIASQGALATLSQVNLGASGRVYRDDGSTRLTDALAVTSLGTASAIASQGALATLSQVNLGASGRVYRDDGSTRLTDAIAVTSLGTAAAFASQGPWATYASAVATITRPGLNLLMDGGMELKLQGWTMGGWTWGINASGVPNVYSTTAGQTMVSPRFPATAAVAYIATIDVSVAFLLTVATVFYIEWYNSSDVSIGTSATTQITSGASGRVSSSQLTSPANTAYGRLKVLTSTIAGGGIIVLEKMKVEIGSSPTVFSDDSTLAAMQRTYITTGRAIDQRALPPIAAMNLGSRYTGAVAYTSAAGTPATGNITVAAGSMLIGTTAVSYNAMNVNVTGTNSTTVTHYLYVTENADPATWGGTKTLVATTNRDNVYSGDDRIYLGFADVTFPASGSGGGGGTGGGGQCVAADAWVEVLHPCFVQGRTFRETRGRWHVRARDVVAGDRVRVLAADLESTRWELVTENKLSPARCWRIRSASGIEVTLSDATPITLRDGSLISVAEIDGHLLPVMVDRLAWEACSARALGNQEVAHIRCGQGTYAAGDVAGAAILTHNPKP